MIVDHQAHWFPPSFLETLRKRATWPRLVTFDGLPALEVADGAVLPVRPELADLDLQFASADENGIDVLVSSPITCGETSFLDPAEAAELLEELNEAVGAAQRRHPDRFVGLAMLPMQDPDRAIAVLDRAVSRDGLRGVSVLASNDGRPIATAETLPVYRRIEELDLPVVLHPAFRSSTFRGQHRSRAEAGVGWMVQTALAAVEMIDSGTLDACPGLVVVHPHLGGVLPYVAGRANRYTSIAERSLYEYLRTQFYVDTVSATPGALRLAVTAYGLDRVVFATDYPFIAMAPGREYVDAELDQAQRDAIYENRVPNLVLPDAKPA